MGRLRAITIAIACAGCMACSSKPTPSPPTVTPPSDSVSVTGRERLGWDQTSASLAELDTVGYNLYVDDQPGRLNNVACSPGSASGAFTCLAPLPPMSSGSHTLQLTSFYLDAQTSESAKSGALKLVVTGITTDMANATVPRPGSSAATTTSNPQSASARSDEAWPEALVRIADGLDQPSDLAFTPDSRLWIAERSGRVRLVRGGQLLSEPALTIDQHADAGALLSLAVDPQFISNHFIFGVFAERSKSGRLTFAIARFREAGDTLADRIVILDNVPASAEARAVIRFGADGKLYAAFDDGGDARLVDDPSSFNGKILRLNSNGTTPDDSPLKSPIFSAGPASPRGLAWHRPSGRLWAADVSSIGAVRWTTPPRALASVHDDLLVGGDGGLVRAHIDRNNPARIAGAEDVIRGLPVRATAIAPDGAIYVATDTAVGRLKQ